MGDIRGLDRIESSRHSVTERLPIWKGGICIYRVVEGKIVEEWWCEDGVGMLQQMGGQIALADGTLDRS